MRPASVRPAGFPVIGSRGFLKQKRPGEDPGVGNERLTVYLAVISLMSTVNVSYLAGRSAS